MKQKLLTALLLLSGLSAYGFSPYESRLLSGAQTHVALLASAHAGQDKELQAALRSLNERKIGISSISTMRGKATLMPSGPLNLRKPSRS
jgi:hypothetical protein